MGMLQQWYHCSGGEKVSVDDAMTEKGGSKIDVKEKERLEYNAKVEGLRRSEYPMLKGSTYLDHAGTTLPSSTLISTFSHHLRTLLLSNPHSATISSPSSPTSTTPTTNLSATLITKTRHQVLSFLNASPSDYEVIFVANATAGIKLVADAFAAHTQGFDYLYHKDAHTSLVGVRELAAWSWCFESDEQVEEWLRSGEKPGDGDNGEEGRRPTLFAYPGQSNMNGRRLPLSWTGTSSSFSSSPSVKPYTLLDAAALATTTSLNLSACNPDFTVLSFYKIFGFPDLGALIVKKSAAHVFDKRKYFGGGTTEMITCSNANDADGRTGVWHAKKEASLAARLEDGTAATHSILALTCALNTHTQLFGSMTDVSAHTGWLAAKLHSRLSQLRHENGTPLCLIYKALTSTFADPSTQGATLAFNIQRPNGSFVGSWAVGAAASARNIYIRTGSLCNPAGMAEALGLSAGDVQTAFASGFRCGMQADVRGGVPFGMVRVSFGAASTLRDVDAAVEFLRECYLERGGESGDSVEVSRSSGASEEASVVKRARGGPAGGKYRRRCGVLRMFGKVFGNREEL